MTISRTIVCSTCGYKIRLRHQVGYVYPAVVKIPCFQCGKIIKGHIRKTNPEFDFPTEMVTKGYEETTQTLSISTELPIALKVSNIQGLGALTPFLGIATIIKHEKIKSYENKIEKFINLYESKYQNLQTSFELFENRNWEYYLFEVNKHLKMEVSLELKTFEECSSVLKEVNKDFFKSIETEYYQDNFNRKLQSETIDKVSSKIPDLKALRQIIETYINIESVLLRENIFAWSVGSKNPRKTRRGLDAFMQNFEHTIRSVNSGVRSYLPCYFVRINSPGRSVRKIIVIVKLIDRVDALW
jgi:hypothetical protein